MSPQAGPYHPGELEVQRRAGVQEAARRVGRIVAGEIPPMARPFLASARLAVAGSLDESGRVWASLLEGRPGFIALVDEHLLHIDAATPAGDPLGVNIGGRSELGLLVIDLPTRRRMRFNGRAMIDRDGGIFLLVDQAYGNCPKYIQVRRPIRSGPTGTGSARLGALTPRQQSWIAGADTFFIASFHPEGGADASHRGGHPGFVRVLSDRRLSFPDYAGNNMFNTLGNIAGYPSVGLLFVDFTTGDLLQITGRAAVVWDTRADQADRRSHDAVVSLDIDDIIETHGGSGMRWEFIEYSPANP